MLKQLILDGVPVLSQANEAARQFLEKHVARSIVRQSQSEAGTLDGSFLAQLLLCDSTAKACMEAMINDLTGGSLQSFNAVSEVLPSLGLNAASFAEVKDDVNNALRVRNQIIHEMDVDFTRARRNRARRTREMMIGMANTIVELAKRILAQVDEQLTNVSHTR